MKKVDYWHKNRHTDQWNRKEIPKINSYTNVSLIFDKGCTMEERRSRQWVVPGKSGSYMWKNEVSTVSNTRHKNKLKRDWDLHVRPDSVKLLEENINRTLSDMNHSNIFLDLCPKAKEIKAKINKWGLIKFKSFCRAKETINKMERLTKQENICKWYYQ